MLKVACNLDKTYKIKLFWENVKIPKSLLLNKKSVAFCKLRANFFRRSCHGPHYIRKSSAVRCFFFLIFVVIKIKMLF